MEVVLRCENYVQVDALTVVDCGQALVIVNKLITNSEMRDVNNKGTSTKCLIYRDQIFRDNSIFLRLTL